MLIRPAKTVWKYFLFCCQILIISISDHVWEWLGVRGVRQLTMGVQHWMMDSVMCIRSALVECSVLELLTTTKYQVSLASVMRLFC